MQRIQKMCNNIDKYTLVTISYKKICEDNITYLKIINISDSSKPTITTPEYTKVSFLEKENIHKYYICRLWSYKLDKFISIDYIRKLEAPIMYSMTPRLDLINKINNMKLNIENMCYDKISKTPIVINSHNDNGLYDPYPDTYYGLIYKDSLDNNEPIICAFGIDKEKLIELNNENNNVCYLTKIPYVGGNDDTIFYGCTNSPHMQGIFGTNKLMPDKDFLSCNPIVMYEYYDDGIMNA